MFFGTINSFVSPVIISMVSFASLLSVFFIVWGGIAYITSSGNPQKLSRAKRIIIRALLGLVIVISAASISLVLNHAYGPLTTHVSQQLPQLAAIKPASSSGGLVDILIKSITGVFDVIIESAARPFIEALSYFTKGTPLLTDNSSVMHLWVICSGIADGLMVLVIALIGFHVMSAEQFGLRDINLKTLIPQILLTFVVINSSIYLLDGLIELSNAMIAALRAGIGNITPWQSLYNIVSGVTAYSLAAVIILIIFLIFTVILLIYYIGRLVALYLGAVLSPLIVLLWLIPGTRDFAESALKTYVATIFVLFIHVVILALAGSLFADIANGSKGTPDPIMSLILGIATLVALIKTQGVLMQLNYSTLGPKTARKLGGSFINGISYLAITTRYSFAGNFPQLLERGIKGPSQFVKGNNTANTAQLENNNNIQPARPSVGTKK